MISQVDLEDFPEQLDLLAEDITTFSDCLNEFPEFNDNAINVCINSFAGDLKVCMTFDLRSSCNIFEQYWSSCLAEYDGRFCRSIPEDDSQDPQVNSGIRRYNVIFKTLHMRWANILILLREH